MLGGLCDSAQLGRASFATMERKHVRALRHFYLDLIFSPFGGVVLRDLET